MRRMSKIAALGLVAALAFTGCGRSENNPSDGGTKAAADNTICKDAEGDTKVGLAFDVGGVGDQSFNDSAYAGLKKAVAELGVGCTTGEAVQDEAESAREDRLRTMADADMNPIIGVGFAYSEAVDKVSADYPDTNFAVIDGFDPTGDAPNDNVAYLGFAENEGSFLVGAAAGLKTKTNKVGFVGGVHMDLIKKFEAGFAQGVKAVNPKAKVLVGYIQESDLKGFGDPEGGKQVANGQLDKGADVIYHAAGGSGAGVFAAVTEAGKGQWAIGVDSDQYLTAPADQQAHILTSMLKRVDVATFDMIKSVVDGAPLKSYSTFDLKADGVGYATSGGFVDDIKAKLDKWAEKIKSGSLKVKDKP